MMQPPEQFTSFSLPTSRWRVCVAPMLDCTDRHCRYLLRLISRHTLLYSEMIAARALLRGDHRRLLQFDPAEQPLALQVGGSIPEEMAWCAQLAEDAGYSEVNINVGCPSDRVQGGQFGACLMAEPARVAACVAAMQAVTALPITVKTRIGIDHRDSYSELTEFIATVAAAGCQVFILHARKAWLQGLSPKENRTIPPLRYDVVHQIKRDFPDLTIVLNGGLTTIEQMAAQLQAVDGVMVGRAAYQTPYLLAEIDRCFFGDLRPPRTRLEIVAAFAPYFAQQLQQGVAASAITRHLLGLFHGQAGGRRWRQWLSDPHHRVRADLLGDALRYAGLNHAQPSDF